MTSPQEQVERLVTEWDRAGGDGIVRDITEEYFAMLEEFRNLGRKLAKQERR